MSEMDLEIPSEARQEAALLVSLICKMDREKAEGIVEQALLRRETMGKISQMDKYIEELKSKLELTGKAPQ